MKRVILLTCLMIANIVLSQGLPLTVKQKLMNVENGIVEFSSPESLIYPQKFDSKNIKSIQQRMSDYKVPGVSIAIVDGNAEPYSMAFGVLKEGGIEMVNEETIFQAASTSKLLTSVIVLHYVEKGLLNLDEDVNKYLKSWKVPENEFTKTRKVTLRYLLTHQSGLPSTNFPYDNNSKLPTLLDVVKGETPAKNKAAIPVAEPGAKWQYSNVGYVLLQLVLEDVVGKHFSKIAHEVIFNPLKMKSSTFNYPLIKEWKNREALPHGEDGKAAEPSMHPSAFAHGGLMTTPLDLAKFSSEIINAFHGKSNKIIGKEYAQKLLTKELDLDPALYGIPLGEGLGVVLLNKGDDILFAHPGSNLPGTNCWLIACAKKEKCIVVMTNGAMGEVLAMEIIAAIEREFNW